MNLLAGEHEYLFPYKQHALVPLWSSSKNGVDDSGRTRHSHRSSYSSEPARGLFASIRSYPRFTSSSINNSYREDLYFSTIKNTMCSTSANIKNTTCGHLEKD